MKAPHPIFRQLARIRRDQKVTQTALAKRLFLHHQVVSRRETGRDMPSLAETDRQARELGYRLALIPLKGTE